MCKLMILAKNILLQSSISFLQKFFPLLIMKNQHRTSILRTQQLHKIMDNLLKIPRRHSLIHPCEERTRYANILQWLTSSLSGLKSRNLSPQQITSQQQQLIVSSLSELIQLTRKECIEKGIILQMVLQYFISTLNASWNHFQSAQKQIKYQFQHNSLQVQKGYINELKSLQQQNEELKKDKEHRWRNMFMLIKDNRVHRKQNKKLLKAFNQQVEKQSIMAQQMLSHQLQNQRLKIKLSHYEQISPQILQFIEANLHITQLQQKVKQYPKKTRKMLKNQLLKIQIKQNKNLKEKVQFIINAIEQTGQIIDDMYQDDPMMGHLQFNISTQTQNKTQERGFNTPSIKVADAISQTFKYQHTLLDYVDTVSVRVLPPKKEKKENPRQNRNAMFATSTAFSKYGLYPKKQEPKSRGVSRRAISNFAVVQSLKITILQGRIAYISTHNTQQFNSVEIVQEVQKNVQAQLKLSQLRRKKAPNVTQQYTQTNAENNVVPEPSLMNITMRQTIKSFSKINTLKDLGSNQKHRGQRVLQISEQANICYDPRKQKKKQRQISERSDSIRSSSMLKKLNRDRLLDIKKNMDKQVKFSIKKINSSEKQKDKENIKEVQQHQQPKQMPQIRLTKTQTVTQHQEPLKQDEDMTKPTFKSTSQQVSSIMTPVQYKQMKSVTKSKAFNSTCDNFSSLVQKPASKRNLSGVINSSQIKKIQANSKLNKVGNKDYKHRRTATESNDNEQELRSVVQFQSAVKMKPLHRISQDFTQYQKVNEPKGDTQMSIKNNQKSLKILFTGVKQVETVLKDIDFSKIVQKILKNIQVRFNQVIKNNHTFKIYLSSFFKCFYGKQLYPNFIKYLQRTPNMTSNQDELIITFHKLTNPKLPQHYSADLFKTFAATVNKCYQINQHPLSSRNRLDILKYMVNQFYEEEDTIHFQTKMRKIFCFSLVGWFNCLQSQVRNKIIKSELFTFLSDITPETQDTISSSTVEQLSFFISSDPLIYQQIIKAKFQIGDKTQFHRFCLFCLRNKWNRMLNIESTISNEYHKKIGNFNYQRSLKQIQKYLQDLSAFKTIDRWARYWFSLHSKYKCVINRSFLMLCQLVILEVKLRQTLPLSTSLKCLNLAFDGLRKKRYFEETRQRME